MKVIIAGAGIASLILAERLGKNGFEVTVFEKEKEENLGYDWHDDISSDGFCFNRLQMPDRGTWFPKKAWSFVSPSKKVTLRLGAGDKFVGYDISTKRNALAHQYLEYAKPYAKFNFETKVEKAILEGDKVIGVVANGQEYYADLVIDDAGVFSPIKASLPDRFFIHKTENKEVFFAYRGYFLPREGVEIPTYHTNVAVIKHMGGQGISWCVVDPFDEVNVLIGQVGGLSPTEISERMADMKASNPVIGDQLIRGGGVYPIPVRRPIPCMVADGYACVGDCACMTIPVCGSGVACSMTGARYLAEVLIAEKKSDKATLWKYNKKFYDYYGADFIGIDYIRQYLLTMDVKEINDLFESGIITEKDLEGDILVGKPDITLADIWDKIKKCVPRMGLVIKLLSALVRMKLYSLKAKRIPKEYDLDKIKAWANSIDKHFN